MANNKIIVKRTTTSERQPNTTASYATNSQYIGAGELALNMADGILYSSNGSTVIEIGTNNTIQNISTNNLTVGTTMYVVAGGNVGIGNTAPNAKLQVTGTANVSGNVAIAGITTFGANVILGSSGLSANGSFGSAGQVLHSNGTATYWDTDDSGGAGSVNTDAQYIWTNTHTFSNTITYGNSTVNAVVNSTSIKLSNSTVNTIFTIPTTSDYSATNVFLHANGSWVTVSAGSVNTDAQYVWSNTHTFNANVTIGSTGELIINNAAGIYANGSLGTDGQVLTSNGTTVYWATSSGGTFDYGLTYAIKAISF